eukprot:9045338-Pyramimonas_sp.AAC.1
MSWQRCEDPVDERHLVRVPVKMRGHRGGDLRHLRGAVDQLPPEGFAMISASCRRQSCLTCAKSKHAL